MPEIMRGPGLLDLCVLGSRYTQTGLLERVCLDFGYGSYGVCRGNDVVFWLVLFTRVSD